MSRKLVLIPVALFCFSLGLYIWKVKNTGIEFMEPSVSKIANAAKNGAILVGSERISKEDLEWEYRLYSSSLLLADEKGQEQDLGESIASFYGPLRQKLMTYLIERKLLYTYIKEHTDFDFHSRDRLVSCISEWKESLANGPVMSDADNLRLRGRLCESSIIEQYLAERVSNAEKIHQSEINKYFEVHKGKFSFPRRVLIRQIVLASENKAKQIRHRVNSSNFNAFARKYSITPEAAVGGLLGPFAKGQLPRFFDVAFSMRLGEIRGVLKSTYGFHIIKLEKKLPKVEPTLAAAEEEVRKLLEKDKYHQEYQSCLRMALNTVSINTYSGRGL